MLYNYSIFFDLDDTLYDRSEPFVKAFQEFCPSASDQAKEVYLACNRRGDEVFLASQRGEITMDEMYIYRYSKGFGDRGLPITDREALEFQSIYRERQKEISLSEGVPELLEYCSEQFHAMGLLTNGPAEKQRKKVEVLGLSRWFSEEMMLISGVVKIDKPDPGIFHLAEKAAGTEADHMIYAGDSMYNDIRPAASLGWKTIYLNRWNQPLSKDDPCPDLVIAGEEIFSPGHLEKLASSFL